MIPVFVDVIKWMISIAEVVGVVANTVLVLLIIRNTPRSFANYSLILLHCALLDFFESFAELLVMQRYIFAEGSQIIVSYGPCGSASFFFVLHCVLLVFVLESIVVLAIGFWYRYYILVSRMPSRRTILFISMLTYVPTVISEVFYFYSRTDQAPIFKLFASLYPEENADKTLVIFGQAFSPIFAIPVAYNCFLCSASMSFILVMRHKAIHALALHSSKMSTKTHEMHRCMIKALTIHSLSPVVLVCSSLLVMLQVANALPRATGPLQEFGVFFFLAFPPVINPFVTIYFISPYRKAVSKIIRKKSTSESLGVI